MSYPLLRTLSARLAIGLLLLVASAGRAAASAPADTTRWLLPFLGKSGKLRIIPSQAARVLRLPALERFFGSKGEDLDPGFHDAEMEAPDGDAVHLISLVPFAAKEHGLLGQYRLGVWPGERSGRELSCERLGDELSRGEPSGAGWSETSPAGASSPDSSAPDCP